MTSYNPFQIDAKYRRERRERRRHWAKITGLYIVIVLTFWLTMAFLFSR